MKRKILLLMLTLGFLRCISAQTPRMLDNGFNLIPGPHPKMVKATEPNNTDNTNTPQRAHQAKENSITHNVDIVIDFNSDNQTIESLALISTDAIKSR